MSVAGGEPEALQPGNHSGMNHALNTSADAAVTFTAIHGDEPPEGTGAEETPQRTVGEAIADAAGNRVVVKLLAHLAPYPAVQASSPSTAMPIDHADLPLKFVVHKADAKRK